MTDDEVLEAAKAAYRLDDERAGWAVINSHASLPTFNEHGYSNDSLRARFRDFLLNEPNADLNKWQVAYGLIRPTLRRAGGHTWSRRSEDEP